MNRKPSGIEALLSALKWSSGLKRKNTFSSNAQWKKAKTVRRAVKGKKRTGRSLTKTKRKKYKRTHVGTQRDLTSGYVAVMYKKPKRANNVTWSKQPLTYEALTPWSCVSGVATTTQSKNAITMIDNSSVQGLCGSSQLTELFERHTRSVNVGTAAGDVILDANATDNRYNTLYLKNARTELNFTNQAPTTCEVDIYVVCLKNSQTAIQSPLLKWQLGLTAMDLTGGLNVDSFLGNRPTMSKRFNMDYRVVAKGFFKMDPGEERKFIYNFKPQRFLDTDHLTEYAGGVKGIYHDIIVVARGPVADSATGFTAANIATSKVKIVGTKRTTYTSYACNTFPRLLYQASALSTGNAALFSIADAAGTVINTEQAANYA